MIKKNIVAPLFMGTMMVLASCGTENKTEEKTSENKTEEVKEEPKAEEKKYKVYKADIAKEFPDAELMLGSGGEGHWEPAGTENENGKITEEFGFSVSNYELAKPTDGEVDRHCAVSGKGQHIHFIVNNGPYLAKYEPEFTAELEKGTNIILSFLSRSYHESIKNGKAFDITKVSYGGEANKYDNVDLEKDHMLFYSRPKGTYKGADAEKILLDFYLLNTELAADGYKVKATINGEEHILDAWAPYFVEGLAAGENTFQIQLIDEQGNLVDCEFNDSGERVITLEKEEEHAHNEDDHDHDHDSHEGHSH